MSTTGHDYSSAPRDPRAMTEDEWRASLPSFGQQLGTGLGQPSTSAATPAPSVAPFSTQPRTWRAAPPTSNTRWVWWMIFLPVILGVLIWPGAVAIFGFEQVLGYLAGYTTDAGILGFMGYLVGAALVTLILTIVFAFNDRSALRQLGHGRAASPWWLLLSPLVYLIIRTVHAHGETGRGAAPLVVYICLQVAPVVLGVIAAIALPALLFTISPPTFGP
ncbi:hypothetical protein OH146_10465 [Salinibacterium sp. SYSU T00001]|uniref:hypothetical protein n=1 Tax=Homoserinimonas sedimenticola TaxID=2986805 RepID=UPI00223640C7|nr:hypothetical protein [Salinibacterium sedimenticola]MCW4386193.1 hypothetical protein [Salinibacterium sedimenticola]